MIKVVTMSSLRDLVSLVNWWFNRGIGLSHPGWCLRIGSVNVVSDTLSMEVSLRYHDYDYETCLVTEKVTEKGVDSGTIVDQVVEWANTCICSLYGGTGVTENDRITAVGGRDDDDISPEVRSAVTAWQDRVQNIAEGFEIGGEFADDFLTASTISEVDFDDNVNNSIVFTIHDKVEDLDVRDVSTFDYECDGCIDKESLSEFLESKREYITSELVKFYKTHRFDAHSKMSGYDSDKRAETKKPVDKSKNKAEEQRTKEQQKAQIRKAIKKIMSR